MAEEKKHTEISPSKLQRVILCPGSVKLARQVEASKPNAAADRGTRLHDLTEQIITGKASLADIEDHNDKMAVSFAIDGYKQLREKVASYGEEPLEKFEEFIKIFDNPEVSGTTDIMLVGKDVIAIGDYKFGNTEVSATENNQLLAYAYGAMKKHDLRKHVLLCIIQPSRDTVDIYETTGEAVIDWAAEKALPACCEALGPKPRLVPGQVQCRWCPAMGLCPKAHSFVQENAKKVFEAYSELNALSPEAIVEVMTIIPELEAAIKAIKAQAKSLAGTNKLPGYKLVRKKAHRNWTDEDEVFKVLDSYEVAEKLAAKGMCVDDLFVHELRSPSQVEKLLGKKFVEENISKFIYNPEGEIALVTEDDPRPNVATDPFAEYAVRDEEEN